MLTRSENNRLAYIGECLGEAAIMESAEFNGEVSKGKMTPFILNSLRAAQYEMESYCLTDLSVPLEYVYNKSNRGKLDTIETVRDIPGGYDLVSISQDVESILESIGYPGDYDDYGCLFVFVGNAEYDSVYGCFQSVAWLNASVDKLL